MCEQLITNFTCRECHRTMYSKTETTEPCPDYDPVASTTGDCGDITLSEEVWIDAEICSRCQKKIDEGR